MKDKEAERLGIPVNKRKVTGTKPGDHCNIIRGNFPPCEEILNKDGACRLHCRAVTVNAASLSELCPQYRMKGAARCKRHGARNRKGALHPNFKDGRWSKYAPKRYAAMIEVVRAGDPLDLHDDIHLVSARIAELLERVDEEGSPDFVKQVTGLLKRLISTLGPSLTNEANNIVGEIQSMLKVAGKEFSLWGEVSDLFGQRVKMVESQRKRDLEGGKYVTAEDMIVMVNSMGLALKRKLEARLPKEEADSLLTDIGQEFALIQGVGTTELIQDGGEQ